MTGLPEYRNGGLLIDMQVLIPKHEGVVSHRWITLALLLLAHLFTLIRFRLVCLTLLTRKSLLSGER
jgi:hypothetical protein